jgi:hypothetical protein
LNGTLMLHIGGQTHTREELATLPTPPGTETWKPVPYYELVESLIEGLTAHNIAITPGHEPPHAARGGSQVLPG